MLEGLVAEGSPSQRAELSYHFFEALRAGGDVDKAIHCALQAGDAADAQLAYEEAATGSLLSWDAKTRLQLALCFAAETCAEAVRLVSEAAGSSAIRLEHRFERHFRDVHVLTQHTSKATPRYATAGRLLFGLENDWIWLSF